MTDPMRGETARAVSARKKVSEGEAKSTKVGLYSSRIGRRGLYGKTSKVRSATSEHHGGSGKDQRPATVQPDGIATTVRRFRRLRP